MNQAFQKFVQDSKILAEKRGMAWGLPVDDAGRIKDGHEWNLTTLSGAPPPPVFRLSDLGLDFRSRTVLNERREAAGRPPLSPAPLSAHWQNLVKAAVVRQLLVDRNAPNHILGQIARPLRVIATTVSGGSRGEPWEMTADDVRLAIEIGAAIQPSGKLKQSIENQIRNLFDAHHLCDRGPFGYMLLRKSDTPAVRGRVHLRRTLDERRSEAKLPGAAELWLLVDIVFTRRPETFVDRLRFAIIKVLLLCGFRVGEACTLPADWERRHEYVDVNGRPAGELGGVSTSILLRHFAEKQSSAAENSVVFHESLQHVPPQFEPILRDALEEIRNLTHPLRERLSAQVKTGRMFPEFAQSNLITLPEAYVRLTGNPIWRLERPPIDLLDAYKRMPGQAEAAAIAAHQAASRSRATVPFYQYWHRWEGTGGAPIRKPNGGVHGGKRQGVEQLCLLVSDLERHVREHLPTKLSDTQSLPLTMGTMSPQELLFLMPKRALAEGRNEGICDIWRVASVGRVVPNDIIPLLTVQGKSLFFRYGETEAERASTLNTHALRHLQNGELFRLGISDAAITKRFGRRTVTQSHVYDHRSLAEELQAMDLPKAASALPERAQTIAKMIAAGRANGHIVDEFRGIQREYGDQAAFEFLAAEADGFHVTPYGFCVNGFTQEPCPKHLQCANGCNRLISSGNDKHRANLQALEARTARAVAEIEARKTGVGRNNQLAHARTALANIRKILSTPDGEIVFPDGPDLFSSMEPRTVLDD